MKVSAKSLTMKGVSIVCMIMAFVGMALEFFTLSVSSSISKYNFNNWATNIENYKQISSLCGTMWTIAKVFMIIAFVVLALLAVVSIVEVFFSHKYLALAKRVLSIAGIVCVAVFFIAHLAGGIALGSEMSGEYITYTILPSVGVYFILLFGLASSITALVDKQ